MIRVVSAAAAALVLAAPPLAAQAPAPAPSLRIGYVRTQAILSEAPGRADVEAALEKEFRRLSDSSQKIQADFQKQVEAFQKAAPGMQPKAREARDSTLAARGVQVQIEVQSLERAFEEKRRDFMQPLSAQIRLVLDDLRREEGLALLFDADAAGGGLIVSSDKNLDFTDRVITKLRTMPKPAFPTATVAQPPAAEQKPPVGPVAQPAGVTRKPPTP
jgi:outer membrane protein